MCIPIDWSLWTRPVVHLQLGPLVPARYEVRLGSQALAHDRLSSASFSYAYSVGADGSWQTTVTDVYGRMVTRIEYDANTGIQSFTDFSNANIII